MSLLMLPRPDSNTDQELSAQLDDPDCVSAERGHGWVKRSANSQKNYLTTAKKNRVL